MHYAITYVSTASESLTAQDISELLKYSKHSNNDDDITGILLFSEGNFFQVLEGKKEKVLALYEKIKNDDRHRNIIKIISKEIHKEAYDGYEADFISENSYVNPEKFQDYLNYLKVLDKPTQVAVENMLKAFII
ncbi:Sensors of blue-light using FAD [Salegentibacter echinorum]|uniref:Sensors of blue-light using FAD n=1 Tax=Salegentibacter echinorum TaxID=1073325 RepID=A0A1M5GI86_SALEC|nr:BLUF domain-containing protein [Salegentibacter echinorum]SHG03460.1 Sensors of blue-light using FAD [Salegentibacter echinorum]